MHLYAVQGLIHAFKRERGVKGSTLKLLKKFSPFLSEKLGAQHGKPQCLLSGDTSQSAGKNAFQIQSGALYSEKLCDGLNPRRETPQRLPQVN